MHEPIDIPRSKHKASAQLHRIFAEFVLVVSAGFGPFAGCEVVFAEQMEQRSFFKLESAIGLAVAVNQKREFDAGIFAEGLGVVASAEADGDQLRAFVTEFLLMVAQLRDVLTAEDSSVVAKKDDDRRAVGPKRAEGLLLSVHVGKRDGGQPAAEGFAHGQPFSGEGRGVSSGGPQGHSTRTPLGGLDTADSREALSFVIPIRAAERNLLTLTRSALMTTAWPLNEPAQGIGEL
jgi:hypothetical protein